LLIHLHLSPFDSGLIEIRNKKAERPKRYWGAVDIIDDIKEQGIWTPNRRVEVLSGARYAHFERILHSATSKLRLKD
jgi:hypothetical protein